MAQMAQISGCTDTFGRVEYDNILENFEEIHVERIFTIYEGAK